jgi:hypothetical protein
MTPGTCVLSRHMLDTRVPGYVKHQVGLEKTPGHDSGRDSQAGRRCRFPGAVSEGRLGYPPDDLISYLPSQESDWRRTGPEYDWPAQLVLCDKRYLRPLEWLPL